MEPLVQCNDVTIVTRVEWGARPSKTIKYMGTPVGVVFIHHTLMSKCVTSDQCAEEMRTIQNFHMDTRGWDDIAYNYLIGEDGNAYEGRAWDRIGSHTLGWNDVAIAFSFMGDYSHKLPSDAAICTLQAMIQWGVALGKISPNYELYGHRDVRDTECPGDKLYELIQTWDHFKASTPVKPTPMPYQMTR
uniref:Peptidoglycan-recognition protein n=1 Tax=Archivesica packardana TaxID=1299447 RepID=A0A344TAZ5_9BIVA|nr:peptidoglycan recognition protein 1 [Archivesica packardana]